MADVGQPLDRFVEERQQVGEGEEGADRDVAALLDDQVGADAEDDDVADARGQMEAGLEAGAEPDEAEPGEEGRFVAAVVGVDRLLRQTEGLDLAVGGEALRGGVLGPGVEAGEPAGLVLPAGAHGDVADREDRDDDQDEHAEERVEDDHGDRGRQGQQRLVGAGADEQGGGLLDLAHVLGEGGHQLAGLGAGVEAVRQALQVHEEALADRAGDALDQPVLGVGAAGGDDGVEEKDQEEGDREDDEIPIALEVEDDVVDDLHDGERDRDREGDPQHHVDGHLRGFQPVRPEELAQPADHDPEGEAAPWAVPDFGQPGRLQRAERLVVDGDRGLLAPRRVVLGQEAAERRTAEVVDQVGDEGGRHRVVAGGGAGRQPGKDRDRPLGLDLGADQLVGGFDAAAPVEACPGDADQPVDEEVLGRRFAEPTGDQGADDRLVEVIERRFRLDDDRRAGRSVRGRDRIGEVEVDPFAWAHVLRLEQAEQRRGQPFGPLVDLACPPGGRGTGGRMERDPAAGRGLPRDAGAVRAGAGRAIGRRIHRTPILVRPPGPDAPAATARRFRAGLIACVVASILTARACLGQYGPYGPAAGRTRCAPTAPRSWARCRVRQRRGRGRRSGRRAGGRGGRRRWWSGSS